MSTLFHDPRGTLLTLANASEDSVGTQKALRTAESFSIPLSRDNSITSPLYALTKGPLLLQPHECASSAPIGIFGENDILRALVMHASETACATLSPNIDEFLELERCLRSSDQTKQQTAVLRIEQTLTRNGGTFLVGDKLTIADIAVVVTLSSKNMNIFTSQVIDTYLARHSSLHWRPPTVHSITDTPSTHSENDNDGSIIGGIQEVFEVAIKMAFPLAMSLQLKVKVEPSKQLKFGDYQCITAIALFHTLKRLNKLPVGIGTSLEIAEHIVKTVPKTNPIIYELTVSPPGFILCRVQRSYLERHVTQLFREGNVRCAKVSPDKVVVVDFSSPNIAKEMHVGHLRSTIIGESVCRLLEFGGAMVKRVNHVGDWGTQFGMLISYLKEECVGFSEEGKNVSIRQLTELYQQAKIKFDTNEQFKKTSQSNVVKLQAGDLDCLTYWKRLCDISRQEFEKVYQRLNVTLEECGESFYSSRIPPIIEQCEQAGILTVQDGGAKCVFVPNYKIPLMLQKSNGGYGYDSTDMAALKYRLHELHASRLVYITDFSQADHFRMCFAAAKQLNWLTPKHKLQHIGFGTVMGNDGKRFQTRSGQCVRLVDLLDEAVHRMQCILHQRIADHKSNIRPEEVPDTAAALGYGAVKYFDLRRNPTTNYKFSYDQMLDTKGNTAIYLLYAHARLESICNKAKLTHHMDVDALQSKSCHMVLSHPSERILALQLQRFSDMITEVLQDLLPHKVCDYLYALSIAVSDFVTQCKVLGSKEMESRLLLCRTTAMVMRQCFELLGIRTVMRL